MKCFITVLIESLEVSNDVFLTKLIFRSLYDRGIEIEVYIIKQNETVSPLKFAFEAFFSPLCSLRVAKTNNAAIYVRIGGLSTYIGILVCALQHALWAHSVVCIQQSVEGPDMSVLFVSSQQPLTRRRNDKLGRTDQKVQKLAFSE
jgi:hypothetical protein